MLVATGGSIAVWTTQQDTRGVLVAAHDLRAGTVLTAGDLAVARARLDDALYDAALSSQQLNSVLGRQLAEPAHANQVLVRAQLSTHPIVAPDQEIVSVPVRIDNTAGGRVRAGDAIQILGTDKKDGTTRVVLPRITVYEVGAPQATSSSSVSLSTPSTSANLSWLSVIADQQQALLLTQAKYSGDLDVALLAPQQTPNQ